MKKVALIVALLALVLVQPVFAVTVDELQDARTKMFEGKSTTKQVHMLVDKVLKENNSEKDIVYIAHAVKSSAFLLITCFSIRLIQQVVDVDVIKLR